MIIPIIKLLGVVPQNGITPHYLCAMNQLKKKIMALWKISVKYSGNVACKNKRQRLEKGMFVETSTVSTIIPLGQSREAPMLAQLFMSKYGIEVDPKQMNRSNFDCIKIG